MDEVERDLGEAICGLDTEGLRREYLENDRFVFLDRFLPMALLDRWSAEVDDLLPHVHRSVIPGHKKGGSVDYGTIGNLAPTIHAVYRSRAFNQFLAGLFGAATQPCPESDHHSCALYCYTEPGDHIGFHYDTSYYRDRRFTVLIGVRDDSSSRLIYRLHTRNPAREVREGEVATRPGSLVAFDGDRVLHRVSPLGPGEARFTVTMQYVTDPGMVGPLRFVSQMKDAVAYFGFRHVFSRSGRR